jgi:glycosyltransferase involved in cell wall biosynthesis
VKLEEGRAQLVELRDDFTVSLGDSQFNADELRALGFQNVDVLPICLDFRRFDVDPDAAVAGRLADGRKNILFVGRFAPNKAHDDLIRVLASLRSSMSNVRLILAGRYDGNEAYFAELQALAEQQGVFDDVIFTGLITDAELLAYYQGSHLFLSLSDHEGFCVPLVEAMWFDLPIIAYGSSAVGETMGSSGIVLRDKSDHDAIGALIRIIFGDEELRRKILESERLRRDDFRIENTLATFDRIVDGLLTRKRVRK